MTRLSRDALASMVFDEIGSKQVDRSEKPPEQKELGIKGLSRLCMKLGVEESTPADYETGVNLIDADDERIYNLTKIFQAVIIKIDANDESSQVTFDAISAMHRDMAHMFERIVGTPYIRPET